MMKFNALATCCFSVQTDSCRIYIDNAKQIVFYLGTFLFFACGLVKATLNHLKNLNNDIHFLYVW